MVHEPKRFIQKPDFDLAVSIPFLEPPPYNGQIVLGWRDTKELVFLMLHSHPSNFCLYSHSLSSKSLAGGKCVSIPPLGSVSPNQRFGGISSIIGNNLQENVVYIVNNVVCGQTCNYEGCISPTLDAQKDRRPMPEPLCLWRSQYLM